MKFRGLISDSNAMKDFMNLVTSISKLAKAVVLRITKDKIYFIISEEENGPRRPMGWCELPNNYYFTQFNMVGVSDDHNEIYLEFSPVMLSKSLTSLRQNARSLKIKLTNKQTPCLTLEIEMASNDGMQNRQLVHDIPVEIIGRRQWDDYKEPVFQDFHVTLQMPNLKSVKNIVERMKTMSHYLIVSATKDGRLTLKIEATLIKLSAHFPNLCIQSIADGFVNHGTTTILDDDEIEDSNRQFVTCQIDIKKFLTFLSGLQITNNKTICSIVNEKMVKLHFEQPGVVTFYCFLTNVSD